MNDEAQIEAFHDQGSDALLPVYHLNAIATSRLTPKGGTVVDLGSGSARYLGYLAARRPDLRIIGIELAPAMVRVGRQYLERCRVAERVELRLGDMTNFASSIQEQVHTVSSVFSLHHLPTTALLASCLEQMRTLRERDGSALWIFDFARPRDSHTLKLFPAVFTPDAPLVFNEDTSNSLAAAFSPAELGVCFADVSPSAGLHLVSRWMRLYQIYACAGAHVAPSGTEAWSEGVLSTEALENWKKLQALFPALGTGP